ncbi:60S ribosomal protein L27-like isoform 1 [Planoprotostelium fungivorum]|uniref:60S ribosomal protein L27 n=1 Tax=Planoprotostelium fungivorum TaxID=1890364 RepID=A0A2P6NPW8_9EUKA|nr:60S ribosomal protein L27-like isoform 1 [Planoprotostelium fungivorum]
MESLSLTSQSLKTGKVVVVLNGRYTGRKAVVVQTFDKGTKARPFGHALIAGVDRYPLRVHKKMTLKRIAARSHVKPFVKAINFSHLMPTRYGLDIDLSAVNPENATDKGRKASIRRKVTRAFEERYKSGKNRWFFTKLRF